METTTGNENQHTEAAMGQKTPLNKYALICALFASVNSILLGYGESLLSISLFQFFFNVLTAFIDFLQSDFKIAINSNYPQNVVI